MRLTAGVACDSIVNEIEFLVTAVCDGGRLSLLSFLERRRPMSNLQRIEQRHRPDVWRDIIFIMGATLLAALSIGSLTSRAAGNVPERQGTLTVLESSVEVSRWRRRAGPGPGQRTRWPRGPGPERTGGNTAASSSTPPDRGRRSLATGAANRRGAAARGRSRSSDRGCRPASP